MIKIRSKFLPVFAFILLLATLGEIQCIYKGITAFYSGETKRGSYYSLAFVTLTGSVIGYFEIPEISTPAPIYYEPDDSTTK